MSNPIERPSIEPQYQSLSRYYLQDFQVNGVHWSSFWETLWRLLASLIRLVHQDYPEATAAEQKQLVVELAAEFFDQFVALLIIPYCPAWLKAYLVAPILRRFWRSILASAVDTLVALFERSSWQDHLQRLQTSPGHLPFVPY